MDIGLHVKYPFSCQPEFSKQDFKKPSNIKFHENLSSGSRVVPCGRKDGQVDMTKPIFALCNFAKEPETLFITSQKLKLQLVS